MAAYNKVSIVTQVKRDKNPKWIRIQEDIWVKLQKIIGRVTTVYLKVNKR